MPHSVLITATFAVSLAVAPSLYAEDLQCKTETAFNGGARKGVDLKLKVEAGTVAHLSVNSYVATGNEGGGRSCSLDSASPEGTIKWSRAKADTSLRITDTSSRKESVLRISARTQGYRVTLENVWSGYCAFGAEFPHSITLTRGRAKCSVVD